MNNRKVVYLRLVREVKAVRAAVNPAPAVYADGAGELCLTARPAVYTFPQRTLVWGQIAS